MTENTRRPETNLEMAVEWSLQHEVDYTRTALIKRARSLADDLTRLAEGLTANPDYGFNTLGVLQGNGVELDTWCVKLGFARETLKSLRQAITADAQEAK